MAIADNLNFVKNNIVYIHGLFDNSVSEKVIPDLDKLIEEELKKKEGEIIFDISSNGGYVTVLQQLLGRIENLKKEGIIVETRVYGSAYSCGSMLACAGSKGHRFIGEFAEHLCHLGRGAGYGPENDVELKRMTEKNQHHFDFVRKLYQRYAKIPNLKKVINDDLLFIRGKQIIAWGLADKFFHNKK